MTKAVITAVLSTKSRVITRACHWLFCMLCCALLPPATLAQTPPAEQAQTQATGQTQATAQTEDNRLNVSLLLGDSVARQALDVIAELKADMASLQAVDIRIHSSTRLGSADRDYIASADLIVLQMTGRQLVGQLSTELAQAIADGATVLAYGSSINDSDRRAGFVEDPLASLYFGTASRANLRNGLLHVLSLAGYDVELAAPETIPASGLYEASSGRWFSQHDEFLAVYKNHKPAQPWVGFVVYRSNIVDGTTSHLNSVINALEQRGFNVLTVFGYPPERPIEAFFFDDQGTPRVQAVVAAGMNIGINPQTMVPLLSRLDVPVINAISLFSMSAQEWQESPIGMDIMERSWQLAMPEMAGMIQPTVFAAKELLVDPASGLQYVEERAIPERVEMLASRIQRRVTLRQKPAAEKKVLLQYFNFPPGQDAIGASYLNVVPQSLWQVMQRMQQEGYSLDGMPGTAEELQQQVTQYGANLPPWESDAIRTVAESNRVVLLPLATYEQWFAELPAAARVAVTERWGQPADNIGMPYTDSDGQRYFVLPVLRYGNIILAPQPSRGTYENADKLYHDVQFPPPHQYIAFYLWLQREFAADAMFQFGTHGTHEWLPGKEAGLSADDAPEYLIQDIPNLYTFIMDNTGEGTIAMRRGMATMITHLTPPFDRAGLNPELRALEAKLNDYKIAVQQSPLLAEQHLQEIRRLSENMGLFTDLGIHAEGDGHSHHEAHDLSDPAQMVDAMHHYLEELSGRITPMGMHTLGVAPSDERIRASAQAIASVDTSLSTAALAAREAELEGLIRESAVRELDAVIAGLSGRYIAAGVGGDPLRTPEALPTGRNFASFDPRRVPDSSAYTLGKQLADELLQSYQQQHGTYPDKLTFTLWGVETMRHEGIQEAQIMALMGVRPIYDALGVVRGIEAVPTAELGRPRIDVTVIPSGLYRDLFSNVLDLLDTAVSIALAQDEPDNFVRINMLQTQDALVQQGIDAALATRMASVRLFSVPPGAYGTTLENIIDRSDSWESEAQIADVYFMRMSHLYGQGFWGASGADASGDADTDNALGRQLLQSALSGTDLTVHARSSHVYQVLDGDDPFASFGGVSLAIRAVDGTTPPVMISNLADASNTRQETLERFMGRELRSRYLNPEWITAMQDEGYAGAKFINDVVQNLWGWQVTVPEAVGNSKWNEMYETYVQDRHDLDIEEFFRDAGNLAALQSMMSRMLEAIRKGYWEAAEEVTADLGAQLQRLNEELLIDCETGNCQDPLLEKLMAAQLLPAPAALAPAPPLPSAPSPSPSEAAAPAEPAEPAEPAVQTATATPAMQPVQGYALEEVSRTLTSAPPAAARWMPYAVLLLLLSCFGWGFLRRQ